MNNHEIIESAGPMQPSSDGRFDRVNIMRAGCKYYNGAGEVHRHTAYIDDECYQDGSSISTLSPMCAHIDSSTQFSVDEIDVIMGHDECGVVSCDGSPPPMSSACDAMTKSTPPTLVRPGNPRPSLSQSSSPSPASSASSSLSLVQRLLGRSRRRDRNHPPTPSRPPECISVPQRQKKQTRSQACSHSMHISISEQELHCLLESEVGYLQRQQQDLQDSLANLDNNTKCARRELLLALASCGGDAKDASLVAAVKGLERLRYATEKAKILHELEEVGRVLARRWDKLEEICIANSLSLPNMKPPEQVQPSPGHRARLEGNWFTLTKPTYPDCLGHNDAGNPMYSLGRMSFEMFRPGALVVSIEAVFNPIAEVVRESCLLSVPKALREEVGLILENGAGGGRRTALMTYHIVTAFQIEPYAPSFGPSSPNLTVHKPIRGIMTTYGYSLPDPTHPNRLSVWFSGGKMECGESRRSPEFQVWKKIFGYSGDDAGSLSNKKRRRRPPRRTFREGAMVAAARLLLGAEGYNDGMDEETGEMAYSFSRPVGGHGKAYVDLLHCDDQTRVMRGHAGTLYVFTRLGSKGGSKKV